MHFSTVFSGLSLAALALAAPGHYHTGGKCGAISPAYAKLVVSQFTTDGIIPDLIEAPTLGTPKVKVNVAYGSKQVNLGTYFTTAQTLLPPTLSFTGEKNHNPQTTKYIYFLVDPDVPAPNTPVTQANFNHWTVSDAQPFCVTNQSPKTIVDYEPLTPASNTQHRYTFLVYRQPPGFEVSTVQEAMLNVRTPFDLNDFTQDNNLILVGGNFLKEAISNGNQG